MLVSFLVLVPDPPAFQRDGYVSHLRAARFVDEECMRWSLPLPVDTCNSDGQLREPFIAGLDVEDLLKLRDLNSSASVIFAGVAVWCASVAGIEGQQMSQMVQE